MQWLADIQNLFATAYRNDLTSLFSKDAVLVKTDIIVRATVSETNLVIVECASPADPLLSLDKLNGQVFKGTRLVIKHCLAEHYEVPSHILIEFTDYVLMVGIHRYLSANGIRIPCREKRDISKSFAKNSRCPHWNRFGL